MASSFLSKIHADKPELLLLLSENRAPNIETLLKLLLNNWGVSSKMN